MDSQRHRGNTPEQLSTGINDTAEAAATNQNTTESTNGGLQDDKALMVPTAQHGRPASRGLCKQLRAYLNRIRGLVRLIKTGPINAVQYRAADSCKLVQHGRDVEITRMGPAGHHVRSMQVGPSTSGTDFCVTWASGDTLYRMAAIGKSIQAILRGVEGISCLAQDSQGYLWWGTRDGQLGRVSLARHHHQQKDEAVIADVRITALAVEASRSSCCCWVGLESGQLMLCRLKGGDSSSSSSLADLSHGEPLKGASLQPGCLSGSSEGQITRIQLGPAAILFVAAGTTAAAATLQIWDSSSSPPRMLHSLVIAQYDWLGRSPITSMTLLHPSSIKQSTGSSYSGPAGLPPAAAAAAAAAAGNIGLSGSLNLNTPHNNNSSDAGFQQPYLVTGHANGMVAIWVMPSNNDNGSSGRLVPLLHFKPSSSTAAALPAAIKGVGIAVQGLAVVEDAGILCCGHASGKVALHRLTSNAFANARASMVRQMSKGGQQQQQQQKQRVVPDPERWWPDTAVLHAHVTGLSQLVVAGDLLVTAGRSGSVKRWQFDMQAVYKLLGVRSDPSATLPCSFAQPGIHNPSSQSSIYTQASLMVAAPGSSTQAPSGSTDLPSGSTSLPAASGQPNCPSGFSMSGLTGVGPAWSANPSAAAAATGGSGGGTSSGLSLVQQQFPPGWGPQYAGAAPLLTPPSPTVQQQQIKQSSAAPFVQQQQQQLQRQVSPLEAMIQLHIEQQQQLQLMQASLLQNAVEQPLQPQWQQQQQEEQQQQQQQHEEEQQQQQAPGRALLRCSTSKWARDIEHSSCYVPVEDLELDPDRPNPEARCLGQGSFGRVERRMLRGTAVAVKFLAGSAPEAALPEAVWDRVQLKEVRREVEALMERPHPNVVLFMGVCLKPPALITELCETGSLDKVLARARRSPASLNVKVLDLALDAANGMTHLHSLGILHRDLKSPNLFLDGHRLKVGDLGLCHRLGQGSEIARSQIDINAAWCAPETMCWDGDSCHYAAYSDVYSYGMIMWELLTWELPWEPPYTYWSDFCSTAQLQCRIMGAVRAGKRPKLPSDPAEFGQLPGVKRLAAAAPGFILLMQRCWDQDVSKRPKFEEVGRQLKALKHLKQHAVSQAVVSAAIAEAAALAAAAGTEAHRPAAAVAAASLSTVARRAEGAELAAAEAASAGSTVVGKATQAACAKLHAPLDHSPPDVSPVAADVALPATSSQGGQQHALAPRASIVAPSPFMQLQGNVLSGAVTGAADSPAALISSFPASMFATQ